MRLGGFLCVFSVSDSVSVSVSVFVSVSVTVSVSVSVFVSVGLSHARFLSLSCFLVISLSLSYHGTLLLASLPGLTTVSVGTNSSAYCEDECSVGHEYRVLQCHAWLVVVLSLAIPILALAVFSFLWRKKSKQRKRDLALTRGLLLHEHSYVDNRKYGECAHAIYIYTIGTNILV